MPQLGCQQTSCLSINLKLNSSSLVFPQLSKLSDPTLFMPSNITVTPTNSARNLGEIFDSSFTFSEHISSVSKSCFLSIRELRRIWNTLDYSSAQTIATSLIHSKIGNCIILSFSILLAVNLIAFNLFSTPQLELFLKPLASAISHPSSNIYTGSKLISAFSTNVSLSPTKHFNQKNLPISTAFSTFKLTRLLVHLLLSLFRVHQLTLVSK